LEASVSVLSESALIGFVGSSDLDRSREFYCGKLGLTFVEQSEFACVVTAGGTTLRITAVPDVQPRPYTVLGWRVTDIVGALAELARSGVAPLRYDFLEQDGHGVWTSPSGARIAWFSDPDGNTLSLGEFGAG
jgi:catechol 2,3-dioxygenase-like lactoylglutathione lyase family enzyme